MCPALGCLPWHQQLWHFLFSPRFPPPRALPSPGALRHPRRRGRRGTRGHRGTEATNGGSPRHRGPPSLPAPGEFFGVPPCPHPPGWRFGDAGPGDGGAASPGGERPRPRGATAHRAPSPSRRGGAGPPGFHGDRPLLPIAALPARFRPPEPGPAEGQREAVRASGDAPRGHPATLGARRPQLSVPIRGFTAGEIRCPRGGTAVTRHGRAGHGPGRVPRSCRGSGAVRDPLPGDCDPCPASPGR